MAHVRSKYIPAKQISVSAGFGPGHLESSSVAMVLENSRKILHSTRRFRMPSPHLALQSPQSATMKLKDVKILGFDMKLQCGNTTEQDTCREGWISNIQ